jgi:hypothetical protein
LTDDERLTYDAISFWYHILMSKREVTNDEKYDAQGD